MECVATIAFTAAAIQAGAEMGAWEHGMEVYVAPTLAGVALAALVSWVIPYGLSHDYAITIMTLDLLGSILFLAIDDHVLTGLAVQNLFMLAANALYAFRSEERVLMFPMVLIFPQFSGLLQQDFRAINSMQALIICTATLATHIARGSTTYFDEVAGLLVNITQFRYVTTMVVVLYTQLSRYGHTFHEKLLLGSTAWLGPLGTMMIMNHTLQSPLFPAIDAQELVPCLLSGLHFLISPSHPFLAHLLTPWFYESNYAPVIVAVGFLLDGIPCTLRVFLSIGILASLPLLTIYPSWDPNYMRPQTIWIIVAITGMVNPFFASCTLTFLVEGWVKRLLIFQVVIGVAMATLVAIK